MIRTLLARRRHSAAQEIQRRTAQCPARTIPMAIFNFLLNLCLVLAGLAVLYFGLRGIRLALLRNTNAQLWPQRAELLRYMATQPQTYAYFHGGEALPADDPDRTFVLYVCKALADFMEQLFSAQYKMPHEDWMLWYQFIAANYENNPTLRWYIREHRHTYSAALLSFANGHDARMAAKAS